MRELWGDAYIGLDKYDTIGVDYKLERIKQNYPFILGTGKLYAWGSNTKGQVGTGSSSSKPIELRKFVGGDSSVEFIAISAGKSHSLALTKKGQIYSWGNAKYNGSGKNEK
jgi:alpha-tubulin suppressor-like RCC1 family protein